MLRFLHTADWQIGRSYTRFEADDAAALSESRYEVIERIARHAAHGQFDAIVVAGDVFDAQTVSDRTLRRLFNAMATYHGPWVLISGNHDAALAESVWTRARQLDLVPDTVFLALEPGVLLLDALHLAILPAPLTQRHTSSDLTAWFDHADTPDGYFRIGVAHGSVQGILPDTIDAPNPIAPDRAATARLDYLALGDWHGTRCIDDHTWYSGTPETDRFRNNDSGQILEIEIDAPGTAPRVTTLRTGRYIWKSWDQELILPGDVDMLLERLSRLSDTHVLDLAVSGSVALSDQARLQQGLGAAEGRLRALLCDTDSLVLQPTEDDIAALKADGYLAEVVQTLQEMQAQGRSDLPEGATPAVARDALTLLASILDEVRP